ncbi:hypothetical protein Dehly_1258 [Dehalogenimonas lykanthroporepellens BL-DC-9]|nr:hypothetical protein Dehly_1258 [Dehalogenimonas lykanthroporepellens BL-DC-9]
MNFPAWVPEEIPEKYPHPEIAISALEKDATEWRAAHALFWQLTCGKWRTGALDKDGIFIYSKDELPSFATWGDMSCYAYWLDRCLNIIRNTKTIPPSEKLSQINKSPLAYVQLHLVTLLLKAYKEGEWTTSQEIEDVRSDVKFGHQTFHAATSPA